MQKEPPFTRRFAVFSFGGSACLYYKRGGGECQMIFPAFRQKEN